MISPDFKLLCFSALLLISCSHLHAESEHHHGAHVHGEANLAIAMEGKTIEIEFQSPAINLLGFERSAQNSAELERVDHTKTTLMTTDQLFRFISSDCAAQSVEVDMTAVIPQETHEHHHEEHHGEISSHYVFECKDIKALNTIDIVMFHQFPLLEHINAVIVTETEQKAMTLDKQQTLIPIQ